MADKKNKRPENVKGRYYVDETCIASKYCTAVAGENFRMSEEGYAYVYKQPENEREEAQAREALKGCPVFAIGDDNG